MNNDLISRSALRKQFGYTDEWYKSRTVAQIIDNAPTVEPSEWQYEWLKRMVEEVVRPKGEWEEIKTNPPEFLDHKFYICSECGREIDVITPGESLDDYPYCHCGARMIRREENDNK